MLLSIKQSVRACGRADLHGLCNMASITYSKLSSVWAKSGHPCGLLSITDPSWHHFHTHQQSIAARSIMSFKQLLETWCVAVTGSVLIIPPLQCDVALTSTPSQLNSKHHCTWWWSVWEWHVGQVFLPHLYYTVSMCKLFAWVQLVIVINKTEKSHKDKCVCVCVCVYTHTHTLLTVGTDTLKNYSIVYHRMKAWTVSWFECVNVADMHNRPNGITYST